MKYGVFICTRLYLHFKRMPHHSKYKCFFIASLIGLRPHTTWGFLFDTPTTQIHDHSLSWLDKDGAVKLVVLCLKITEIQFVYKLNGDVVTHQCEACLAYTHCCNETYLYFHHHHLHHHYYHHLKNKKQLYIIYISIHILSY